MGIHAEAYVDNGTHMLFIAGRVFPCDRDVEALARWKDHVLLLSSDTDCLSLWDEEGLVRTTRVGVFPQDMVVMGDTACVCGGADGRLHLLTLPSLEAAADIPLPGMPERLCLLDGALYILTLLPEEPLHTSLLKLDTSSGRHQELLRLPGLPGVTAADAGGLWIAVSEKLLHLPKDDTQPDLIIEGFGLVQRIEVQQDALFVHDPVEGQQVRITLHPRPSIEVLQQCVDTSRIIT